MGLVNVFLKLNNLNKWFLAPGGATKKPTLMSGLKDVQNVSLQPYLQVHVCSTDCSKPPIF